MIQNSEATLVEQLWYTWSTIGLDAAELEAGFRVRAASPGLRDLYGERMKQLDRYLRYSLPSGTDLLNTAPFRPEKRYSPDDPPICLAFIRTESGERALVHKIYTGKDRYGRDGAYFAHLLVLKQSSTEDFLVRDAIRFWRFFDFWRTVDVPDAPEEIQRTFLLDLSLVPSEYTLTSSVSNRLIHLPGVKTSPEVKPVRAYSHIRLYSDILEKLPKITFESNQEVGRPQSGGIALKNIEAIENRLHFIVYAYLLRQIVIERQKKYIEIIRESIKKMELEIAGGGISRKELRQKREVLEESEARLQLEIRREYPRIFIAAPPDDVADLIACLATLLPRQLLTDMTFSTYEKDVLVNQPLDIIGTCVPPVWLNASKAGRDILPDVCYKKGFVLNTYLKDEQDREKCTLLPSIMLDGSEPWQNLALDYTDYMLGELKDLWKAQTWKRQKTLHDADFPYIFIEEVYTLEREIEERRKARRESDKFAISSYLLLFANRQQISLAENTQFLSEFATAAESLQKLPFGKQLFVRKYQNHEQAEATRKNRETREEHLDWLQSLQRKNDTGLTPLPVLLRNLCLLCQPTSRVNTVAAQDLRARLDELAEVPANEIYEAAKQAYKRVEQSKWEHLKQRFHALFVPLRALEPEPLRFPEPITRVWVNLLNQCCTDPQSKGFISIDWEARRQLLEIAVEVLPSHSPISLFLLDVEIGSFEKLQSVLESLAPDRFGRQGGASSQLAWINQAWELFWREPAPPDKPGQEPLSVEYVMQRLSTYGPALLQLDHGWQVVAPFFWWMVEKERGAARNVAILFKLLDQEISNANFTGLFDSKKFTKFFTPEEVHDLVIRYSVSYAEELQAFITGLFASLYLAEGNPNNQNIVMRYTIRDTAHVHDLLMQSSPTYKVAVHTLLISYVDQYLEEINERLIYASAQYMLAVHDVLMRLSSRYEEDIHTFLMSHYPEVYSVEAYEFFVRSVASHKKVGYEILLSKCASFSHNEVYRAEIRALLLRYAIQSEEDFRKLVVAKYGSEYKRAMDGILEHYVANNKKELHEIFFAENKHYREEIHKMLWKSTFTSDKGSYEQLVNDYIFTSSWRQAKQNKPLPQYLALYPDAPLWGQIVALFQKAGHPGRIPLVSVSLDGRSGVQEEPKNEATRAKEPLQDFLTCANLSVQEYYECVYRFGPHYLERPQLQDFVLRYYKSRNNYKRDFLLLYKLLENAPDDAFAEKLLAATQPFNAVEVERYFILYGTTHPAFCYSLPTAQTFYKSVGMQKILPYIPYWLSGNMREADLNAVCEDLPFKLFGSALLEEYGQRYLTKFPHSKAFLKLTQEYLITMDGSILQRAAGRSFLDFLARDEKRLLPPEFKGLTKRIDWFSAMLTFIREPVLEQSRIRSLFVIIDGQGGSVDGQGGRAKKLSWIKPLARVLITRINSGEQLGYVYSAISTVKNEYALECLTEMTECVRVQVKAGSASGWQRAVLLIEYAVLLGVFARSAEDRQRVILTEFVAAGRSYINKQAAFWSPSVQREALKYGITPEKTRRKKLISDESGAHKKVSSGRENSPAVGVLKSEPRPVVELPLPAKLPEGVFKQVQAWLLFPWLLYCLWRLCRQRGVGVARLAFFWSDRCDMLMASASLTPDRWKWHIYFACAFYNYSQEMMDAPAAVEASNKLWFLVSKSENAPYVSTLNAFEKRQIRLARDSGGNGGAGYPAHLAQILNDKVSEDKPSGVKKSLWWFVKKKQGNK